MKKIEPAVLEQPDLVAFISLIKNIQPRPFLRKSDGRVCFSFDDDVEDAIRDFYRNIDVPISDFCKNLKLVRSMIFTLKKGGSR